MCQERSFAKGSWDRSHLAVANDTGLWTCRNVGDLVGARAAEAGASEGGRHDDVKN